MRMARGLTMPHAGKVALPQIGLTLGIFDGEEEDLIETSAIRD